MSHSPLTFDPYIINNVLGTSFLDVGCGYGKWGFLLKKYLRDEQKNTAPRVVGIDRFEAHARAVASERIYDQVLTADGCALPFQDQSFDSIVACEVLEHLPQESGKPFIAELKRVARQCFVVTTPNYPCLRGGHMTKDGFNEFEAHHHIYSYREFCELGFTQIIGLGRMQLPKWRLGVAAASLGIYFPSRSRYLMGFWFADGKQRQLFAE